ncbi:MAG: SMP-30/gluconolactonase/LRE family protein [Euzebya sp.]
MSRSLSTLREGGHFFEGPRWHNGGWWVSDFYDHTVVIITTDGLAQTVMEVPGQPSGLGWMPDGSLLVVSMTDHKLLRRDLEGAVTEHAQFGEHCGGPANDMIVDVDGRAFVGNFGFDVMAGADPRLTNLVRVDPDGTVSVAAKDLYFPNGCVILPDECTLIVAETIGCRFTAFTIQPDGSLTDRRIWAQVADTPELGSLNEVLAATKVAPDGCTLDADGNIWLADALGGRVLRVAEGGSILEQIDMPQGLGAFACQLGGPDGTTLLICAAPDFDAHQRAAATEAVLLTTTVDSPHAGRP